MIVDDLLGDLGGDVRDSWDAFIGASAGLRPELFSFGLRLTGNAFDGEDLVQEALVRAFGAAAFQDGGIRSLRSYLFRIMSNLWVDQQRRAGEVLVRTVDHVAVEAVQDDLAAFRAGAERLLGLLAPREQAAVVLHEAFGFRHGEIADLLATTEGAVRSALHRAKTRLAQDDDEAPPMRAADPLVVDRFVEAFRAGDIEAMKTLLAAGVETVVFPVGVGHGAAQAAEEGWLRGALYNHSREHEDSDQPFPNHVRVVELAGDHVLAVSRDGNGGIMLEEIWRFESHDGQITRVRDYGLCPDLVSWAGSTLNLPVRRCPYSFGGHQP